MKRITLIAVSMLLTGVLFAQMFVPCPRCQKREQKIEVIETTYVPLGEVTLKVETLERTCDFCGQKWNTTAGTKLR